MPQGRIILKSICQSRKLAKLKTDGARLLYTWLIPNVDVNGCFSADPQVLKGQIFTRLNKSTKTIGRYLQDLFNMGLIEIYETDSDQYLYIPDFIAKQPYLNPDREAKTTIPPPTPDQLQSRSRVTPPKIESKKKEEIKSKSKYRFLDYVFLTEEEHQKLLKRFGATRTASLIEDLNNGIGSKGYKYKSHYSTILAWAKKDDKKQHTKKQRLLPIVGKICSKDGCKLPAVYKDTSGSYDHYYCAKHLPEEVKELYG